jgi:hypothetical protein
MLRSVWLGPIRDRFQALWGRRRAVARRGRSRARPSLEALEDRSVPSTVMNLNDSGPDSLRQAILDTPSGGTVDFQSGLTGTITLTSGELAISQDLTIAGPGAGVLTVSGNHASRVFDIAANYIVDISGLTIADGMVQGPDAQGGGILNAGTLTVTNSTLRGNSAGGVFGSGRGGGIYNQSGTLTVASSTLTGNFTSGPVNYGGIYNSGTLTVTSSTLSGNSPTFGVGGGIYNSGTLTVISSTLSGNSAITGGGIFNLNGTLTVISSTLRDNSAVGFRSGGGVGGGIYNSGTLTVTSSTLTGNSATAGGVGGGIYNSGTLTVTSSTLTGNSAGSQGGGIFSATPAVTSSGNTIVAGNSASSSPDVTGALTSQGYNLIGDGSGGSGYTSTDLVGTATNPIDPKLGPLQDNGGPTQTRALLPGSPALNAGDPAQLGVADQRGVVRRGGVNIGAYQASASAFALTALTAATAGAPFGLVVTAVDAFGQTAVGYTGTVTFATSDTHAGVVLPADYPFTAADAGRHTFAGATTLVSAGSQTVTATDGSLTGFATVTVNPAAATHLVLSYSANPVAGQAWSVTVTAYDAYGNVATGYRGTVTFKSSDDEAELPRRHTFTAADAGTHTFRVTFGQLGRQSLTATDTLAASLFGTIAVLVQRPGQDGQGQDGQ